MYDDTKFILCMGAVVVVFFGLIILACEHDLETEEEMLAKCAPNPSLYECQLYLSKKGKSNFTPIPIFIPMNTRN
jgi:hypothetical protein